MNWMNWKTWTAVGLLIIAGFAIYTFASADRPQANATARNGNAKSAAATPEVATPGVERVRLDLLEADSGSYKSERNIFEYYEPPPPPPPPPPAPPPPPPDQDKDGIPDFRDNCVSIANPDQRDIDRDGIGSACDEGEVAPPPPPPVPPQFTYKFIGVFGPSSNPLATFARDGDIVNARVGDVIEGKFILRSIGIESAEIGFVGFPADVRQRIPLGQ